MLSAGKAANCRGSNEKYACVSSRTVREGAVTFHSIHVSGHTYRSHCHCRQPIGALPHGRAADTRNAASCFVLQGNPERNYPRKTRKTRIKDKF